MPFKANQTDHTEDQTETEFARMFRESTAQEPEKTGRSAAKRRLSVGDKLRCEILVIGKEEVFVSLGNNKDGSVHRHDLTSLIDLQTGTLTCKPGDFLDLYVILMKGTDIRLSPTSTSKNTATDLQDAFHLKINASHHPFFDQFFYWITEMGNGWFSLLICILVLFFSQYSFCFRLLLYRC